MVGLRALAISALVLLAGFLSGCSGTTCDRPDMPSADVAKDAPSSGGFGSASVELTTVEAGTTTPVAGAALRAYWPAKVERTAGNVIILFPFIVAVSPTDKVTIVYTDLRTGPDGKAILHAPEGARVSVVASSPTHGEEFEHVTASAQAKMTLPLYQSTMVKQVEESWTDAGVTYAYLFGGTDTVEWRPNALPWSESESANKGYTKRLVDVEATLEWTNGIPTRGDLGLGVGTSSDTILSYANENDDTLIDGARTESIHLDLDSLAELEAVADDVVYLGPTWETLVAPTGLPYKLTLKGTFDAGEIRSTYCAPEHRAVVKSYSAAQFQEAVDSGQVQFDHPAENPRPEHSDLPADPDGRESTTTTTNVPFVPKPLESEVRKVGNDQGGSQSSPAWALYGTLAALGAAAFAARRRLR